MTSNTSPNPLSYLGPNPYQNPLTYTWDRIPTSNDVYPPGTQVVYTGTTPYSIYQSAGSGSWSLQGSGSGTVTGIGGNTGTATPSGGVIDIVGDGTTITTTASGNTLTESLIVPVSIVHGGTGLTSTPNNGQLLIGNSGSYSLNTITSTGNTIAITNGTGTINLDVASGGLVTYQEDSGSATPSSGTLNVSGGTGINTSGTSNTITINLDSPVTVAHGGTGTTTSPSNGQLLIGNAGSYSVASLTSTGSTISITAGAGTLDLETAGTVAVSFVEDSGTAVPSVGALNVVGSTGITTSGSGNTVSIALNAPVTVAHGGTQTSSAPTNGQLLIGNSSGTYSIANLTSTGNTVAITNGSGTINLEATTLGSLSFVEDSGTAAPSAGVINIFGGTGISTSGTGNTVTIGLISPVTITRGGTGLSTTPTSGQLLIGNAGNYSLGNLTSTGSTISITNGLGTIDLETAGSVPTSFVENSGTAIASSGVLNISGANGITTTGSSSTVTVSLDVPVTVAHGGTGTTSSPTNGQLLIGNSGAYSLGVPTSSGGTISISTGAGALDLDTAGIIPKSFVEDSGTAVPSAGVLNIRGGSGISTSGSGSTVTITATGSSSSLTWVSGTTGTMAVARGYYVSQSTQQTLTLPATANLGDQIEVVWSASSGGWKIAQNAGQSIRIGNLITTTGTGGSITSTAIGNTVHLVCLDSSNTGLFWLVDFSMGNFTVV